MVRDLASWAITLKSVISRSLPSRGDGGSPVEIVNMSRYKELPEKDVAGASGIDVANGSRGRGTSTNVRHQPRFYMVINNSHRLSYTIDYSHLCPCFPLSFFTETTASSGFGLSPPYDHSGVRSGSGADFYGFQGV